MKTLRAILALIFMSGCVGLVSAAEWDPTKKSIEIIVPYAPGGGSDRTARLVSDIFTAHGWKSVVINRPGNNSIIGANLAAETRPDGYTLFMGGDGTLDANFAFRNQTEGMKYTENSFVPIVPMGKNGLILITAKSSPVNTYEEFRTYVRRNPNRFNVGFWNVNQANVFLAWARLEGLPLPQIIYYKSSALARADVLGGNLDFAFDTVPSTAQLYKADKIKILVAMTNDGVTEVRAIDSAADIPDLSRKHPDLNVHVWRGLYAPAGTNPAVIKQINQVVNHGLKSKEFSARLASVDQYGVGGTPEQLQRTQQDVTNRYKNIGRVIESMPR
jgi:tripartite-type tricarboxylate transporter receptor subunit TctC